MYTFKGNNRATSLINDEQHFILHATSIVVKTRNTIRLNSNGYKTATTKKAMNEVGKMLGFSVYQTKNKWYVNYKGQELDYQDNMELV